MLSSDYTSLYISSITVTSIPRYVCESIDYKNSHWKGKDFKCCVRFLMFPYSYCLFVWLVWSFILLILERWYLNTSIIYLYIAVLIEFRAVPLLVNIILNVLQNIPTDWSIQIFHEENNLKFLLNSVLKVYIQTNRILLHQWEPMTIGYEDYADNLFTNISFW